VHALLDAVGKCGTRSDHAQAIRRWTAIDEVIGLTRPGGSRQTPCTFETSQAQHPERDAGRADRHCGAPRATKGWPGPGLAKQSTSNDQIPVLHRYSRIVLGVAGCWRLYRGTDGISGKWNRRCRTFIAGRVHAAKSVRCKSFGSSPSGASASGSTSGSIGGTILVLPSSPDRRLIACSRARPASPA